MMLVRRAGDVALWVGAVLGGLCLLVVLAATALGVRPLIFTSGSMSPTIGTGSLALADHIPAAEIHVGDVVSVPFDGGRLTHRVVSVSPAAAGRVTLRLKGDANRTPDPRTYTVSGADRVWLAVPHLGSAVAWLSRAPGVYLVAAYAVGLVLLIGRRLRRIALATVGVLGALSVGAAPAWAYWTDDVTVTGSTLTVYTVPTTTLNCGLLGVLSVTFNWPAVPNATNYTLHYGGQTLTTSSTTATITAAITGGTAWVNVNRNFGSVTWTSANSNTRTFTVAVASLCT